MLAKKKPRYSYIFEKTVETFAKKHHLISPVIACAVSGGLDSMSLAFLAGEYLKAGKIQKLIFVHIDHQTRPETSKEKKLVESLARGLGASFLSFKLNSLKLGDADFEYQARLLRQNVYKKVQKDHNAVIWCAHHLDDSFEWSLRQRFSSTTAKPYLGIPVKTPLVTRPFLTVTKKQILSYAKENKIKWSEDNSNQDLRFERAYLRVLLIPVIAKKYPQYLKHYANSSELSLKTSTRTISTQIPEVIISDNSHHYFMAKNSKPHLRLIKKSILKLSGVSQGKLAEQLQKIEGLILNGKMGPLSFSGGVELFHLNHHLIFMKKSDLLCYKQADIQLAPNKSFKFQSYKSYIFSALKEGQVSSCWSAISASHAIEGYKGGHPLMPLSLKTLCDQRDLKIVATWKLLRHMANYPTKAFEIAIIQAYF